MLKAFKTDVKRTVIAAVPFIVLFTVVTLIDVLLQRDVQMQFEQSFQGPFNIVLSYTVLTLK